MLTLLTTQINTHKSSSQPANKHKKKKTKNNENLYEYFLFKTTIKKRMKKRGESGKGVAVLALSYIAISSN